jgi:integrative and conjugative element protein (TIGR02256 family)
LETGGILMGYWTDEFMIVATHCIGPGPNATHERHRFSPDHEWHVDEVARHYAASGRVETYLGDWHTHPDESCAGLSRLDRAAMRRIAASPDARAPAPLMMVLIGAPEDWRYSAWIGRLSRGPLSRLALTPVEVSEDGL